MDPVAIQVLSLLWSWGWSIVAAMLLWVGYFQGGVVGIRLRRLKNRRRGPGKSSRLPKVEKKLPTVVVLSATTPPMDAVIDTVTVDDSQGRFFFCPRHLLRSWLLHTVPSIRPYLPRGRHHQRFPFTPRYSFGCWEATGRMWCQCLSACATGPLWILSGSPLRGAYLAVYVRF